VKRLKTAIISSILLLPHLVYAGQPETAGTAPALTPPTLGGLETTFSIVKILAAFLVVGGVMALVFKLMHKIGPKSMSKAGLIEVLDTRMITQKKYISVIRIADQDLAVAISENNISLLCTLNKTAKKQPVPLDSTFNKTMETAVKQESSQP
jgi:flagellar biogenesis protein FliO